MSTTAPESGYPSSTGATRPGSALDVRIRFVPHLPLVRLAGELDLDSLHLLTDALDAIANAACPGELVVLDLARVTFCDVSGLRALEQCALALEMEGKQLVLHDPPRTVKRLMAMTGVAQWLPVRE